MKKAVNHYNNDRIHRSLPKGMTPNKFTECEVKNGKVEEVYAANRNNFKKKTIVL